MDRKDHQVQCTVIYVLPVLVLVLCVTANTGNILYYYYYYYNNIYYYTIIHDYAYGTL